MTGLRVCTALALVAGLSWPMLAQERGRGGAPFDLNERLRWELMAPWGVAHREALIEGGKLTIMNPVNVDLVRVEPFKMFDNVYFVGIKHVSAFLITTSDGLVLLDTSLPDTTELMLDNIRKVGFKPENIRYVIVTHAHVDHYGGAGRVKQLSGARITMSKEDWDMAERPAQGRGPAVALARDMVVSEGQSLKVGDNEFTFYITPGHTPGATSVAFTVVDRGKRYRALAPGGLGIQFGPEWTAQYAAGIEKLRKLGPWDVVLSNHPFYHIESMDNIRKGVANLGTGPHPMYSGPEKTDQWLAGILKVARAKQAAEQQRPGQ